MGFFFINIMILIYMYRPILAIGLSSTLFIWITLVVLDKVTVDIKLYLTYVQTVHFCNPFEMQDNCVHAQTVETRFHPPQS